MKFNKLKNKYKLIECNKSHQNISQLIDLAYAVC